MAEARKILNVPDNATVEQVDEAYARIFEANSAEKGNSFYLQSKAVRARESLLLEMQVRARQPRREGFPHSRPVASRALIRTTKTRRTQSAPSNEADTREGGVYCGSRVRVGHCAAV